MTAAVTTLSRDDVIQVAGLARLKLSDAEIDLMTVQLAKVLGYVQILNEVDTEEVEPLSHAVELTNVFREDEVRFCLPREAALANAPKSDGVYFLVPQIIEGA
jgi:aspartyl-tRNA(Asn)/glutamyl-tRNA(Gln) amidotransferase subunit C